MSDKQPVSLVADNLRAKRDEYIRLKLQMVGTLYPSIIDDILVDLDGQLHEALYPTPSALKIHPSEQILDDDYPVYFRCWYVADGTPVQCHLYGPPDATVFELRIHLNAGEIRNCDLRARDMLPKPTTPTASRQTSITIDDSGLPVPKNRRY